MSVWKMWVSLPVIGLIALAGCGQEQEAPKLSYEQDIKPIIVGNCLSCHVSGQAGAEKSGLILDSYAGLMKGTKLGPIVVPGSPESSTLYLLISGKADPSIRMPHGKDPLPKAQVEQIRQWIQQGAPQ